MKGGKNFPQLEPDSNKEESSLVRWLALFVRLLLVLSYTVAVLAFAWPNAGLILGICSNWCMVVALVLALGVQLFYVWEIIKTGRSDAECYSLKSQNDLNTDCFYIRANFVKVALFLIAFLFAIVGNTPFCFGSLLIVELLNTVSAFIQLLSKRDGRSLPLLSMIVAGTFVASFASILFSLNTVIVIALLSFGLTLNLVAKFVERRPAQGTIIPYKEVFFDKDHSDQIIKNANST